MTKVLISITNSQRDWLRERAEELEINVSELVRRILEIEREKSNELLRKNSPKRL